MQNRTTHSSTVMEAPAWETGMFFADLENGDSSREILWRHRLPSAEVQITRNHYISPSSYEFRMEGSMLELSLTDRGGQGSVYYGDRGSPVGGRVGNLVYFPADKPFRGYWKNGDETTVRCFFRGDLSEHVQRWSDRDLESTLSIESSDLMYLMNRVARESERNDRFKNEAVQGLILQIYAEVGRYFEKIHFNYGDILSRNSIRKDVEAVLSNRKITSVGGIARALGYSEGHLRRLFWNESGQKISDYVAEYRSSRAMELLRNSGLSIKQIAYQLEFRDPAELSRFFKRRVGVSPRQFRSQLASPPILHSR